MTSDNRLPSMYIAHRVTGVNNFTKLLLLRHFMLKLFSIDEPCWAHESSDGNTDGHTRINRYLHVAFNIIERYNVAITLPLTYSKKLKQHRQRHLLFLIKLYYVP